MTKITPAAAIEIERKHNHALWAWHRFREDDEHKSLADMRLGEASAYEMALRVIGVRYTKGNNGMIRIAEESIS